MLTLVPTERHVETLGAGADEADPTKLELASFARFAAGPHRGPGFRPATRADRVLAVASVLADLGEETSASLASMVDRSIGRLLAAGASAEDLARTRTPRGKRTAEIMRRYASVTEARGVVDGRLPSKSLVIPLDGRVRVRAAVDFTGAFLDTLDRAHIACRAAGGQGVTIEVPRNEDEDGAVAPLLDALERRFGDGADAPDVEYVDVARPRWADARVVVGAGRAAEARRVAFEVAVAVDAGAAVERVGIAVPPGDDAFLEALRFELREADVPWSEPWGRSALHEPEARAVFRLIEMADTRLGRETLLELLLTPGLHAGSWFREPDEAKAMVLARDLAEALRAVPLSYDADGELFAESLREHPLQSDAMRRIGSDVGLLRNVSTRQRLSTVLRGLTDRLQLGEPSARELAAVLAERNADNRALGLGALGDGARAVRSIVVRAEEMALAAHAFGETRRSPLAELSAELASAVAAQPTSPRGASARSAAVRIGPPREMVGLPLDLLVVTRLTSAAYAGQRAADPWLDGATLSRLPPRVRPPSEGDEARVRSAEIIASVAAARRLVLSRSSLDGDGREASGPHAVFLRALAAGALLEAEPASRVAASASAASDRRRELVRLAGGGAPPPDLVARRAIEMERSLFFSDPTCAPGPFSGRILGVTDKLQTKMGVRGRAVAVTVVDVAAACPFRAFAERVLGARKTEDAEEAGAPRDRGELLHQALRIAFDAWKRLPPSATDPDVIAAVLRALDALAHEPHVSPLRRESRLAAVEDVTAVIRAELERRPSLRYALGEQEFGGTDARALPVLELVASDGRQVRLRGAIDRIDLSSDRSTALVIDYKTGKAPAIASIGVTSFQLPLYALALRRALPVTQVGAAYLSVKQAGTVELSPKGEMGRVFEESELDALARRAADLLVRVAGGNVEPRPRTREQCQRCKARDVCRRPVVAPQRENEPEPA